MRVPHGSSKAPAWRTIVCVPHGASRAARAARSEKETGKSRGFAFLAYEDQRSTDLAVDNLNGIRVDDRIIAVDHVADYKRLIENPDAVHGGRAAANPANATVPAAAAAASAEPEEARAARGGPDDGDGGAEPGAGPMSVAEMLRAAEEELGGWRARLESSKRAGPPPAAEAAEHRESRCVLSKPTWPIICVECINGSQSCPDRIQPVRMFVALTTSAAIGPSPRRAATNKGVEKASHKHKKKLKHKSKRSGGEHGSPAPPGEPPSPPAPPGSHGQASRARKRSRSPARDAARSSDGGRVECGGRMRLGGSRPEASTSRSRDDGNRKNAHRESRPHEVRRDQGSSFPRTSHRASAEPSRHARRRDSLPRSGRASPSARYDRRDRS